MFKEGGHSGKAEESEEIHGIPGAGSTLKIQRMPGAGKPREFPAALLEELSDKERRTYETWKEYDGPKRSSAGAAKALEIEEREFRETLASALRKLHKGYYG